jgi:hypothetical protein
VHVGRTPGHWPAKIERSGETNLFQQIVYTAAPAVEMNR